MLLAGAVIQEVLALHRLLDERGGDAPPALLRPGQGGGGLQAVERHPGVAVRHADQRGAGVSVEIDVVACEPTLRVL